MKKGFRYALFATAVLLLAPCSATKYVTQGSYLLDEVRIQTDNREIKPSGLSMYVLSLIHILVDLTGKFYLLDELDERFVKECVDVDAYKEYQGRWVKNAYDLSLIHIYKLRRQDTP